MTKQKTIKGNAKNRRNKVKKFLKKLNIKRSVEVIMKYKNRPAVRLFEKKEDLVDALTIAKGKYVLRAHYFTNPINNNKELNYIEVDLR